MPYLCGMKKLKCLTLLLFVLVTTAAKSQTFDPEEPPIFRAPVGETLTFTSQFTLPNNENMGVMFKSGHQGLTVSPSEFYGNSILIMVTLSWPAYYCWAPVDGIVAVASDDTNRTLGLFCVCDGVFYDSSFIGYPFAHPDSDLSYVDLISETDTLNFGQVVVNDSALHTFVVENDSFPIYRRFTAFNVQAPFKILDTIPLSYPCEGLGGGGMYKPTRVSFHPMSIGNYVDDVNIFDPLRNDSIPLILIGEGVAASVSNSAEEASRIAISPNPCDKHCNLSMNDGQIEHVKARNVLGECMLDIPSLQNEELTISTASLPDGIYFIEIRTNEDVYQERVVVAH
jgi:hypothetical protein